MTTFRGRTIPSPGVRNCCVLTDRLLTSSILELEPATYVHRYGGKGLCPPDRVGFVYTCAAGFIDLGHVRDCVDLTRFYWEELRRDASSGRRLEPPGGMRGTITLNQAVPPDSRLAVARSIAYDESIWHEIETYTDWQRDSSFSPEDLTSNFLGTWVAARAIRAGGTFDVAVAATLHSLLREFGAVSAAGTQQAFDRIKGTWVQGSPLNIGRYLRRRNFDLRPGPWLVDGVPACAGRPGVFPPRDASYTIPAAARSFYDATYEGFNRRTPRRDFPAMIEATRQMARRDYGDSFESPAPVGHRAAG